MFLSACATCEGNAFAKTPPPRVFGNKSQWWWVMCTALLGKERRILRNTRAVRFARTRAHTERHTHARTSELSAHAKSAADFVLSVFPSSHKPHRVRQHNSVAPQRDTHVILIGDSPVRPPFSQPRIVSIRYIHTR